MCEPHNSSHSVCNLPSTSSKMDDSNKSSNRAQIVKSNDGKNMICQMTLPDSTSDRRADTRKLLLACAVCVVFMVIEIVGGVLSNSLAIATDALHLLSDVSSFLISAIMLIMAQRETTKIHTYGFHRAEVLGAVLSILGIWTISIILIWQAILRLMKGNVEVGADIMIYIAATGILADGILLIIVHGAGMSHGHSHGTANDDIETASANELTPLVTGQRKRSDNIQAAILHVIGDLIVSGAVLVAGIVIKYKPEWAFLDPVCTIIFSIVVFGTTFPIIGKLTRILMQAVPKEYEPQKEIIENEVPKIPGIFAIHKYRIWALTSEKLTCTMHVVLHQGVNPYVKNQEIRQLLIEVGGLSDITIQVEPHFPLEDEDCTECTSRTAFDLIAQESDA